MKYLKAAGFCIGASLAWGATVFIAGTLIWGPRMPDWTLAPSMLGGVIVGSVAVFWAMDRWIFVDY